MGRERLAHALLLALTFVGCKGAPATEAPPPSPTPSNAPTTVVVPTENAPIASAPPATEPAPGTAASDTGAQLIGGAPSTATEPAPRVVPSRKGVRVPADSPNAPPPATGAAPTTPPPNVAPPQIPTPAAPPATPFATKVLVSQKLYRIELAPPAPCKPATSCQATLVVHSLDGYKVNAEYPTKFVATASPGVTVNGTGSFAVSAKTVGTMTVAFRAAQAGTARIAGAFKLSVCTDDICEIAAANLAFDMPVTAP